ncbi:hypothetical protein D3C80_1512460 [compost metagenome]
MRKDVAAQQAIAAERENRYWQEIERDAIKDNRMEVIERARRRPMREVRERRREQSGSKMSM